MLSNYCLQICSPTISKKVNQVFIIFVLMALYMPPTNVSGVAFVFLAIPNQNIKLLILIHFREKPFLQLGGFFGVSETT